MPPKKPKALADWTYEYLRDKILNLKIPPGEQIHVEILAERLGVSRTPIREAFQRLASDGLVEIRPRIGYFVTDITEQDIRDLFEIREIVESRAANKAAQTLTDEELEELRLINVESHKAVERGDFEEYLSKEIIFHSYLQKHIHNKRLTAFMESLNNLTHRERIISIQSVENVKLTTKEHQYVIDALLERDGDKAAWYIAEHLKNVSDRLVIMIRDKKEEKENINE